MKKEQRLFLCSRCRVFPGEGESVRHENLFRDLVDERFPAGEPDVVADHIVGHPVNLVVEGSRDVRGEADVRQRIKLRSFQRRLRPGDVEEGGEIGTLFEHFDQSFFIDLCAAAGIDERGVRAHGCEHLLCEDLLIVLPVREMVADDVGGTTITFKLKFFSIS